MTIHLSFIVVSFIVVSVMLNTIQGLLEIILWIITLTEKGVFMNIKKFAAEARKAIVGAVGIVAEVAAANVLHGTAQHVAEGIVAFATVLGVYQVPNRQAS